VIKYFLIDKRLKGTGYLIRLAQRSVGGWNLHECEELNAHLLLVDEDGQTKKPAKNKQVVKVTIEVMEEER
jgi:hypothetical protein